MKQIQKYLGNFGRYQALIYAMYFIPAFLNANMTMVSSFMMATTKTRCKLPGFDDNTTNYDSIPESSLRSFYLEPKDLDGKDAYCKYCPDQISLFVNGSSLSSNCSESMRTEKCQEYIYDHSKWSETITTKYNTVCDNAWKMDLVKSLFMVGVMLSVSIGGSLSDRFGRRPLFVFGCVMQIIVSNLTPVVGNYYLYCVFVVLNGFSISLNFLPGYIIVMELIDGLPRTICGVWVQGFFAAGYLYTGLIAYLIHDWRKLMWSLSAPSLLLLPLCWYFPESIRWQITKGRTAEAKKEIMRAARINGVYIPDAVIEAEFEAYKADISKAQGSVLDLFKHWVLAKNTLIIFFSWLVVSMTYYGLSLNASDLPGNEDVNYALLGIAELPGYILIIPVMEKFGRIPTLVGTLGIGGISCILSGTLPTSVKTLAIVLAIIGKMCIAASFAVVYNYSAEVYPTVVRNAGTGFSSTCARIGSIAAPQIHLLALYVDKWLPITIYGGFALVAAVADIFLPETLNRELPETIEDGIKFSSKSFHNETKEAKKLRLWTVDRTKSKMPIVDSFSEKNGSNSNENFKAL